jgi:N-terminal domain of reverse transcriptase/N-acetylmuramoyl-L-alanine amidase
VRPDSKRVLTWAGEPLNAEADGLMNRRGKLDTIVVNGPEGVALDWDAIDWRAHEQNVIRLRRRIFKATREQDWATVRSLQKLMLGSWSNTLMSVRQVTQHWIDIAYHLSVDRNGNIYQLRDPMLVGDTATSYDPTGHFLVVCEGNFDEEQVSENQLNGAALAFAWAAWQFGIPTETLRGHRDESHDTAFPGASLYEHVSSGDLKQRIDGLLAAGPVSLVDVCGPEASQAVVDIEAGLR